MILTLNDFFKINKNLKFPIYITKIKNFILNFNQFREIYHIILNYKLNLNFNSNILELIYIYNKPNNFITLFLILYLLLCITTVTKICFKNNKSIRKFNLN